MADHEIEMSTKFGLPEIGGFAARVEGRYKATWSSRTKSLVDAAALRAEVEPSVVAARISDDEQIRDSFMAAMARVAHVGDRDYVDALGRLVGASLDSALVDEASYLVAEVIKLEPVQLRVLLRGFTFLRGRTGSALPPNREQRQGSPADSTIARVRLISQSDAESAGGVSGEAATAILERLKAAGFLRDGSVGAAARVAGRTPTAWAGRAVALMFPNLEFVDA